jgi:hypothetical protein
MKNYLLCVLSRPTKQNTQKQLNQNKDGVFGKAKCKLCGEEVRLALKHMRDKHTEIYGREVAGKMKMSSVMKKYFVD